MLADERNAEDEIFHVRWEDSQGFWGINVPDSVCEIVGCGDEGVVRDDLQASDHVRMT